MEYDELVENAVEKCEDVLAEKICTQLREAAEKLKLKAAEIDALVREAIEKKITEATEIAKHIREQLIEKAKNFKCEDALPAPVCGKLKELAEKIKVKAAEVDKLLREIVAEGVTKAKEIIEKIREKLFPALEDEVPFLIENAVEKCEDVLAEKICTQLREAAEKLKLKAAEIDALVREAIEKKITEATEIAKHIREQLI